MENYLFFIGVYIALMTLAFLVHVSCENSRKSFEEDVFKYDFEDYLRNERQVTRIPEGIATIKKLDENGINALLDAGIIYIGEDGKIHVTEN